MSESQTIHSHTDVGFNNRRTLDKDVRHRGLTIPRGFKWDGASTPKPFRMIAPKWGDCSLAFLTHDYLYSIHAPRDITRKHADKILYEDLCALGMSKIRAYLVYKTVDVFGGMYFRVGRPRFSLEDLLKD